MKSSSSKYSIGIVTYNCEALINKCLSSLYSNAPENIKIAIYDNYSVDSTKEIIRSQFPNIDLIEGEKNQGFAHGVNRLIENSNSEFVLIINPDVTLNEKTFLGLVKTLEEDQSCIVAAPTTLDANGNLENNARRFPNLTTQFFESVLGGKIARKLNRSEQIDSKYFNSQIFETDWIKGAIWMIRRATFAELGGMREDFFLYSEETEFALRANQAGWRFLVNTGINAEHLGGESDTNPTLYTLLSLNKIYMIKLHSGKTQFQLIRIFLLIGSILRLKKPTARKLSKSLVKSFYNLEKERRKIIDELGGVVN